MSFIFRRFHIAATFVFGMTSVAFSQQFVATPRDNAVVWPYHPNRPGVEAYMQGGAFVANTGSLASLLFNSAGIAKMSNRVTATVESGWASGTEYLRFFEVNLASNFQSVQFAGIAFQPIRRLSVGAYYAQPSGYDLETEPISITSIDHPDGTGEFLFTSFQRKQTSIGLVLATSLGERFDLGSGVEWRRSNARDELNQIVLEGSAEALRFSVGAILKLWEWQGGISAQTKYKASGDFIAQNSQPIIRVDSPEQYGNNARLEVSAEKFPFYNEEPATIRFGLATPMAFGRLRFNADAEYTDFESDVPIERWQFYGGGSLKLAPNLNLGFGAFTFAKDYSAYIEGPDSEIFWTVGASIEWASLRFSANFMDSDLLTKDFVGQQFFNFAIGYAIL
jgi:hypothetical protein